MLPGQKEQAEAVRLGLIAGFRDVTDAVRWADGVIAADPAPDAEIADIALAAGRDRHQVISLLAAVPGRCDTTVAMRRLLRELLEAFDAEPTRGEQIARWLYSFAVAGNLPESEFGLDPFSLEDIFVGAKAGWNTDDQAFAALREYLVKQALRA